MIKVLHISPHHENDGIAKYQEQYLAGMQSIPGIYNQFFDTSPLKFRNLNPSKQAEALQKLRAELESFDVLHIQHEFGLFAAGDFASFVAVAKAMGKKVVVTVHLSPEYAIKPVSKNVVGPRSLIKYVKNSRNRKRLVSWHIKPFLDSDLLIVHNDITTNALENFGISPAKIKKIPHPVYKFPPVKESSFIKKKLNYKSGDIIYCTVGMMHRYKGTFDAVKALNYLPGNYKLVIIGGMHELSHDTPMYNKLSDYILAHKLKDRVYITGFVKSDQKMNAYIQECAVCVFPYNKKYYDNLSSGSINLALANNMPVIAYPTSAFKELSEDSDGSVVICDTSSYYELARKIQSIDKSKQKELAQKYAEKMAWPKAAKQLAAIYETLAQK